MGRGIIKEYMSVERVGSRRREVYAVLVLGALFFPSLSLAATVTYASNKVMGPTNGLVGYWTMNAQDINWTTNTIIDRSGMGNVGTFVGMATKTAPTMGKVGQGLKFLPSPTVDYIDTGSGDTISDLGPLTVSFWENMQPNGGSGGRVIQKSASPLLIQGWYVQLSSTGIGFNVGASPTKMFSSSQTSTFTGGWHHIVITWDGGLLRSGVTYYRDGVLLGTSASGNDGSGTRQTDVGFPLFIGGYSGQTVSNQFPGSLDEVRIYNRILTPTEIKQLYNVGQVQLASTPKKNTSGLVGWWTFDGPDVNWTTGTVLDRSGSGKNGILTNMATKTSPVAGKLAQGLKFSDQFGGAVVIGSSVKVDNSSSGAITAWIKTSGSNYGLEQTIFGYGGATEVGLGDHLEFYVGTDNSLKFEFGDDINGIVVLGGPVLQTNRWYHVAIVSSDTSYQMYVDGISVSFTGTNNGMWFADVSPNEPDESSIGRLMDDGIQQHDFNGVIDDVRIYNRILSPTEVAKLYKEGQVTVNSFTCGVSTVKDVDGNVYNTVKIGTQCWMKQNMRVGTRINVASNQTNNGIVEKYCYGDNPANCTANNPNQPDGGLYQWNEAMQYSTTPGAQGICPAGWHIPTHDEFTTLERAVCTSGSCATDFPYDTTTTGYRGTTEGTKLKTNGTSLFEGNLSGYSIGGSFNNRGAFGIFWSSLSSGGNAWYRYLVSGFAQVYRYAGDQSGGLSVRCLQN
jgi:uncharacterized protein (TIGR02145 family)